MVKLLIPKRKVIPMARQVKPLTDNEIRSAKPKDKAYRLFDGGGLYLEVSPKGQKWWRLKYLLSKKEKRISLGVYPEVTLKEARLKREQLKEQIANGIDPLTERKIEKQLKRLEESQVECTFEFLTNEYMRHKASLEDAPNEKTLQKTLNRIKKHCYPTLKTVNGEDITEDDVLQIIWRLKEEGYHEIARRVLQLMKSILRHGVKRRYISRNVAVDLQPKEEIGKVTQRNYPIITDPKQLKELLIATSNYTGDFSTAQALKIMPYIAFRPANIRFLEWSEIDLSTKTITIPASKMKMKREYTSPISKQVEEILLSTKKFSGGGKYVFPSPVHHDRPLSDNTLNVGLRRLGYTREHVVSHSFRGIFSTIAHSQMGEHGHSSLAIEKQLSHEDQNTIRGTYNQSDMLDDRVKLMQWWADYLDEVKRG